jgi:hypothetical protein
MYQIMREVAEEARESNRRVEQHVATCIELAAKNASH